MHCHFLLQGIFLTQGIEPEPASPTWQADSLPMATWEASIGRYKMFVFFLMRLALCFSATSFPSSVSIGF